MNIANSNITNIDFTWITETQKLLNETKENMNDLISIQLSKLPDFNIPKVLNTVDFLHNELKKTNPVISTIFLSTFANKFKESETDYSLLTTGLKIQMAVNEIMDDENPIDLKDALERYNIDNTSPEGQKSVIEIVKLIAQIDIYSIANNIHDFGMINQEVLIPIAQSLAKNAPPMLIANTIKKFGITDQNVLIDIAKLIAHKEPFTLAAHIKNFGIIDPNVRIEIAKFIAQKSPFAIAQHIKNFDIISQEILIDIAKSITQEAPYAIVEHINNFEIVDQDELVKIAKSIAQKIPMFFAEKINNFKISNEEERFEIANLIIEHGPQILALYFKNFEITDIKHITQIVEIIAEKDPWGLAKHIQNFKITERSVLIKLAELLAQKDPWIVAFNINNFEITERIAILKLAELIAGDSKALSEYMKNLGIKYNELEGQKLLIEMFKDIFKKNFNKELTNKNSSLNWFEQKLQNPPWDNAVSQTLLWEWMMKIMCVSHRSAECHKLFIEQQLLIREISNLEPQLRDTLTQIYLDLSSDQKQILIEFQGIRDNSTAKTSKKQNSEDNLRHVQLAILLFTTFPPNGKAYYQEALKFLKPLREDLRNGKNQKLLLETLLKIKNCSLSDECKLALIKLLFESKEWQPANFRLVKDLLSFNAESRLQTFDSLNDLKITLEEVFKDQFQVEIENFSAKYENTIGTWRNKEALITYASKLNELVEPEKKQAQEFLKEVVQSVLEGNFHKNRYKTYNNPHMKEIERTHPTLFEKWQEGNQLDMAEIQPFKKEDLIKKLGVSMETFQKKIIDISNERLDIYRFDLLKIEEELTAIKPELEQATKESKTISKNIDKVGKELNELKKLGENKEITQKKVELETLKKELELKQRLKHKETLLKAFSDPQPKSLTDLQNFLMKDIEFYKNKEIEIAIKEFSNGIKDILSFWRTSKGILAEEDFGRVQAPIKNGLKELISEDPARYSQLQICLNNNNLFEENIEISIKRIEEKIKVLSLKNKSKKEQKVIKSQHLYYLKEIALLKVIKKPDTQNLTSLRSLFNKEDIFYQYIEEALKLSKELSKTETFVIDTDDPNHFLLMGTEVDSSCQSIHGGARLNKCLLGYFLDGKHRLSLVCDNSGKILARSVLRLLIDEKGRIVLFQEKIYTADANPEYKELIRKIAKKKAQSLNIPLVVNKKHFPEESDTPYLNNIYAKDKPVPFEYVDALEDSISTPYTLPKEILLQI